MTRRKILLALLLVVLLLTLYLLFWPVPVETEVWTPAPAPELAGTFAPNTRLATTEKLGEGAGHAPESVALDAEGRIYGGMDDGRIMRLQPDGSGAQLFAATGGRPLGMEFDREGNLIVADAVKGLLSIDREGRLTVLSTEADGVPYRTTNDLDIAADGTIYFSDASNKFPLTVYKWDIIEHRPNGRLLAYDPHTKSARLVIGGLYFANGVALSPDQTFVLVVETGKYRVRRVWLKGVRAGQSDIFIENLPGFPDGLSSDGRERFWLALITPRNRLLDALLPRPFLRKALLRIPAAFQPGPERYSFVLGLDTAGRVADNLQDPAGHFAQIASVYPRGDFLYFGSLGENSIGRWRIDDRR
jgi:sugar lactone lactonase YvrE